MSSQDVPTNSWYHKHDELEKFAKSFDSSTRLKLKKSSLWIGGLKHNATTLGASVYIPEDWTYAQARGVIPHEVLGHVKQFRWCGLGVHPALGIFPGMAIIYAWGVLLPVLLAWGRYRCELHAETKSWQYHLSKGLWTTDNVRQRSVQFSKVVASSIYAWAVWKSWAVWGFKRRAEKVIRKSGR